MSNRFYCQLKLQEQRQLKKRAKSKESSVISSEKPKVSIKKKNDI